MDLRVALDPLYPGERRALTPPSPWAGSIIDPLFTLAEVSRWPRAAGSSVSRRAASLDPSSSLGRVNYRPPVYLSGSKRMAEESYILCIQESGEP